MPQPIHNPFYVVLVAVCTALVVTVLITMVMWVNPQKDAPLWVLWIDQNWFRLVVAEVATIVVLAFLTIGLDRFFERSGESESTANPGSGQ